MSDGSEPHEVPNPEGRPPVNSVEFAQALRRLVRTEPDPRWEADAESRRVRDHWDLYLAGDEPRDKTGHELDADVAAWWDERLYIDECDDYLTDPAAWNHPVWQEFLGKWWHPATRLPFLAPTTPISTEAAWDRIFDSKKDKSTDETGSASLSDGGSDADSDDEGARTKDTSRNPSTPATTREPTSALGPMAFTTPRNRLTSAANTGPYLTPPTTQGRIRPTSTSMQTPAATPLPTVRPWTTRQTETLPTPGPAGAPPTQPPPPGRPQVTTGAPSRGSRQPQRTTGNIAQPLRPSLSDMLRPHTWRSQRQPPIGTRLMQILNWVNDEDVDRRRDWARELNEAEDWVREQLDRRDENGLGDDTITLLRQAEAAILTHRRYERYHYRTFMERRVPDPHDMPKYAPRLPYTCADPIELGIAGPKCKTRKILPQGPDTPGPRRAVNDMWLTSREAAVDLTPKLPDVRDKHLGHLAAAEQRLWAPQAGQPPQTPANNMSLLENRSFVRAIANPDGGLRDGWVHWRSDPGEPGEEARFLRDEADPLRNTEKDFATERGARRAGLQAALRQFDSSENHAIANSDRMLVLPGGTQAEAAVDIEEVKRKVGIGRSRPIQLTELPASQLRRIDGKTDPQGFTANMATFWRQARQASEGAHAYAMARTFRHSPDGALHPAPQDANKPLPPRSPFGPFVWRGVPASVQLRQDCLRQMRGLKKLFDREKNIAPRQLLDEMEVAYHRGYNLDQDPSDTVQLVYGRDSKAGPLLENDPDAEQKPHYLDHVEMEWIRFLLNHSMTKGMASEALPRTAIFLTFAQRLERIFNDPGDDLFPDLTTSVTIEDLIAHMAKMKGPVKKTTFYEYDVKMFLERLAYQGRCRYVEDWRTYGRVQRPLLRYFPEDLIVWQPRNDATANVHIHPVDMDIRPETPRFEDVRDWHDVVHQDPPAPLHADVRNYFLCLAYRWGHGTRRLEAQESSWSTAPPLPLPSGAKGITRLLKGFEIEAGDDANRDNPQSVDTILQGLWRCTLGKPDTETPPDGTSAIKEIQRGVIQEVVRADNMLYPGRSADYQNPLAPMTRESIWDWARPQVRGNVKTFFGLGRWPVQLQSAATQQRTKDDVDVDPDMLWNPIVEDPTPWTYYRPKARPYGDEKVKFKEGHRLFPIGDTARQREVVKKQVMAMVGSAMGIESYEPAVDNGGVFSTLKGMLGFGKKRPRALLDNPDDDEDDDDDDLAPRHKLPRVDPSFIPPSVDIVAEAEAAMAAHEEATRPRVIPADQVPADAEDVRFINRAVPSRDNALVVEQNLPL